MAKRRQPVVPRSRRVDRDRAAAIIIVRNHVLLIERRRKEYGRFFVFPGGGLERRERALATVRREVREETGLSIKVIREVFRGLTPEGNVHHYFLATAPYVPVRLPPQAEESDSVRQARRGTYRPCWLPLSRLPRTRIMPPTLKPKLLRALRVGFPPRPVLVGELWSGPRRTVGRQRRNQNQR